MPAGGWASPAEANAAARSWCAEVNGRRHADIAAVPAERLAIERPLLRALPSLRPATASTAVRKVDALSTVRFASARYRVPAGLRGERLELTVEGTELTISRRGIPVARHRLVGPGELSLDDVQYGRTARRPVRALRPRSADELAFLSLGPVAEAFLRAAAASGATRLHLELAEIVPLARSHGREALVVALGRALAFRRFTAVDVRSILADGPAAPRLAAAGDDLPIEVPAVPVRPLSAYALEPSR